MMREAMIMLIRAPLRPRGARWPRRAGSVWLSGPLDYLEQRAARLGGRAVGTTISEAVKVTRR